MSDATGLFKIVFNDSTLLENPINHGGNMGPISEDPNASAAVSRGNPYF